MLEDLEMQRGQLKHTKEMVHETSEATSQVQMYLKKLSDRAFRRKVILWAIIMVLVVADVMLFYYFFIKN